MPKLKLKGKWIAYSRYRLLCDEEVELL